jgi:hypothetical protein
VVDLFRFLHVLSISLWIAAVLWVSGDVRRTIALGRPHVDALESRVRPAFGLDVSAAIATVASGTLLLVAQGISRPRFGIVAGFVLALGRVGVLTALHRVWRSLAERLRQGEEIAPYHRTVRRIAMLSGIAHALWLAALAGMVFPV